MRYWWVNEGKTHEEALSSNYIWSQKRKGDGTTYQFFENMRSVVPGDVFFMYWDSEIGAVGQLLRIAMTRQSRRGLDQMAARKSGRFPALEYTRVQFARNLIRERKALGLTQQALAELAGVRQETLSRLESRKHTISGKTVTKLEKALAAEQKRQRRLHSSRKLAEGYR